MSDVKVDGFKASAVFEQIADGLTKISDAEKKGMIKKTNGVFQLNVKNAEGKEATWTIDLKTNGEVAKGAAKKADVTISLSDQTLLGLADGKINAQKAFMTGQLKVKGNIMLATKLDGVLKGAKANL